MLGWLAFGAALSTRGGERVAVQVGRGLHRPTAAQAAILSSPWSAALPRSQLTPHDVQLYLRRPPEANAYAAGTRSVAPTGLLTEFQAQRLAEDYLEAVPTHELGHRASRAWGLSGVSKARSCAVGATTSGPGTPPRSSTVWTPTYGADSSS